jgi:para-nitrobenzyl esterase
MFATLLTFSFVAGVEFVDLHLKSGTVTGVVVQNHSTPVHKFLGVPFAEPPIGDLRWVSPQKPKRWLLPRPALTYSKSCEQSANPFTVCG